MAVIPDFKAEPDETFLVTLADAGRRRARRSPGGGNDSRRRPPAADAPDRGRGGDHRGERGVTTARFRVVLSHPAAVVVPVSFATVAGTAHAGEDFAPNSGTFRIAVGDTTDTIGVAVIRDLAREPNETFEVEIESSGDVIVIDNRATGLILDDDRLVARFTPGFAGVPAVPGRHAGARVGRLRSRRPARPAPVPQRRSGGLLRDPGFRDLLGQGTFTAPPGATTTATVAWTW